MHDEGRAVQDAGRRLAAALLANGVQAEFVPWQRSALSELAIVPALSPDLMAFYESGAPRRCRFNLAPDALSLYSPEVLAQRQAGYQGEGWPASWLTIGDISGDAVVADTGDEGTPIGLAMHGMGRWQPRWVAPSLGRFLDALAAWVTVLYGQFDASMLDESNDFAEKPGFIDSVREAWAPFLPDAAASEWIDYIRT